MDGWPLYTAARLCATSSHSLEGARPSGSCPWLVDGQGLSLCGILGVARSIASVNAMTVRA
jgi:hypothetical protein